jgi:hypothetical protein
MPNSTHRTPTELRNPGQAAGATDAQLQAVVAEGLQEQYFKDGGRRADGLLVEFTDIDYVELDYS